MYNPFHPTHFGSAADRKRARFSRFFESAEPSIGTSESLGGFDTDDLIRRRWEVSATLGIARAVAAVSEMEKAKSRAKIVSGEDRKSKMLNLINSLSLEGGGHSGGSHLVFQSERGFHSVVESSEPSNRPTISGTPSSSILIGNLASNDVPPHQLVGRVGTECSRFGAVLDAQIIPDGCELGVSVYVRFDTIASSFKAAEGLNGLMFGGKPISVQFVPAR